MNQDLIHQWLDLPAGTWPPDHYTLLALAPREVDGDLIERRIYERMMRVRIYQLNHPDEATEALNRLATAFNCLTDPLAKKNYDASLGADALPPTTRLESVGIDPADPLAWLFGPWSQLTAAPSRNGTSQPTSEPASMPPPSVSADDAKEGWLKRLVRMLASNPSMMRGRRMWKWILQHPGVPLLIVGLLALLLAFIRHLSR